MAGAMQATKSAPMSILGSTMGATHTCFKDSKTGKFFPRQNRKRKLFSGQNFFLDPLAEQAERFDTGRRAGNEKKDAAGHAVHVGSYFVPLNGTDFIVDTGSSVHFAAIDDVIDGTFRSVAVPFDGVADAKGMTAGLGDVMLNTRDTRGKSIEIILHDVYITDKGIRLIQPKPRRDKQGKPDRIPLQTISVGRPTMDRNRRRIPTQVTRQTTEASG